MQYSYEAVGFPANVPPNGYVPASPAQLVWAAISVAARYNPAYFKYIGLSEFIWRVWMVRASLVIRHGSWAVSNSYRSLESSEKGAVSFFLGNVQAARSSSALLGFPCLVHFNSFLEITDQKHKGSRPDFVSYDPVTRNVLILESKGRFGKYEASLPGKAKAQTKTCRFTSTVKTTRVASISWNDATDAWNAYLADPLSSDGHAIESGPAILATHYLLLAQLFGLQRDGSFANLSVIERYCGLRVSMPDYVLKYYIDIVSSDRSTYPVRDLDRIGREISSNWRSSTSSLADDPPDPYFYIGPDQVTVALDGTWRDQFPEELVA